MRTHLVEVIGLVAQPVGPVHSLRTTRALWDVHVHRFHSSRPLVVVVVVVVSAE